MVGVVAYLLGYGKSAADVEGSNEEGKGGKGNGE
jgi:hypothetical protein